MTHNAARSPFPENFLWGVATSGHQTEGDNTTSDTWVLENTTPTIFAEQSGPACQSWERWEEDLDLVAQMGLTAYRFSIEWARVEPVRGEFSGTALDHYEAIVDGCLARGVAPIITLSHFTSPHWFAAGGAWLAADAPELFARYCTAVAERIGDRVHAAVTLNEPNLEQVLVAAGVMPPHVQDLKRQMLEAAAEDAGSRIYRSANVILPEEFEEFQQAFTRAHRAGKAALKAVNPNLPVGVSVAICDEYALPGGEESRDAKRAEVYDYWLHVARHDDFIGVQNYERVVHGPQGPVAPAPDAVVNDMGTVVEPASLAGAATYAHQVTGVPVLVTEHGMATNDDALRAKFIPEALNLLGERIAEGLPVLGYCHWTLLDNFEWVSGYGMKLGLIEVDRSKFTRTPKRSAGVYEEFVRQTVTELSPLAAAEPLR